MNPFTKDSLTSNSVPNILTTSLFLGEKGKLILALLTTLLRACLDLKALALLELAWSSQEGVDSKDFSHIPFLLSLYLLAAASLYSSFSVLLIFPILLFLISSTLLLSVFLCSVFILFYILCRQLTFSP